MRRAVEPRAGRFACGRVDLDLLLPVVLAPPVAEPVLVGAFADLHHRRTRLAYEAGEEVERDADIVRDGLVLQLDQERQELERLRA